MCRVMQWASCMHVAPEDSCQSMSTVNLHSNTLPLIHLGRGGGDGEGLCPYECEVIMLV